MQTTLTTEDRAKRIGRITSSRIAAIAGIYPWKSALQVFDEMQWEIANPEKAIAGENDIEDNEQMERGRWLEGAIRNWTADRIGLPIIKSATKIHPEIDWIAGSSDGAVYMPVKGDATDDTPIATFEAKAPGPYAVIGSEPNDWKDPADHADGIPDFHVPQCAWHMLVDDVGECYCSSLLHGRLLVYCIERDAELEEVLIETGAEFIERLKRDDPPPVDAGEPTNKYLRRRFSHDKGKQYVEVGLEDPAFEFVQELMTIRAGLKDLDHEHTRVQNEIMQIIDDAPGMVTPHGKIHFKEQAGRRTLDKAKLFEYCEEHGIDADQFVKVGKPFRSFLPKLK